ncbi:MAG: tripartite tricarboxylate transporter TctB family protein [Desulfuromonadales bacterium]
MTDRGFAFVLLLFSLLYALMARNIEVPFAYDPLGPKPVPLALATALILLSLLIACRPERNVHFKRIPLANSFYLLGILLFYQTTWLSFGFLLSTTISVYLLTRLFKCSWMQGLMTALVISVSSYGLFNFFLKIKLPLGTIFTYGGG